MIINTFALSGLWYTGSVVPLPAWAEKKINQIIFDFLWSGKNEQIKREVCYLPYELGGLKVVNVALKCKALLAKSVVFITDDQYKAKWVYLARYFIGRDLGKLHESWVFLSVTPNRTLVSSLVLSVCRFGCQGHQRCVCHIRGEVFGGEGNLR